MDKKKFYILFCLIVKLYLLKFTFISATSQNSQSTVGNIDTQDYFTCHEDDEEEAVLQDPGLDSQEPGLDSQNLELESFRCSPSPERQVCAINTETNYPWATMSELLECSSDQKRRFSGFVKRILPDLRRSIDPFQMLSILCTMEDCLTAGVLPRSGRRKRAVSFRCPKCSNPAKIIFNVALLLSETEASNFASTTPSKLVFSSGHQAETLFECSATEFYTSEAVRSDTVAKWIDLVDKPIRVSVNVVLLEDGAKELHLIDSVVS